LVGDRTGANEGEKIGAEVVAGAVVGTGTGAEDGTGGVVGLLKAVTGPVIVPV
jgi:hypothetical protein